MELNKDILLGTALQLIKDINRMVFLGDATTCSKIRNMTDDWLQCLDEQAHTSGDTST